MMVLGCILEKLSCLATCTFNGVSCLLQNHFIAVASIAFAIFAIRWYINSQKAARREKFNSAGKDVVVLHGFPRSKVVSNLSPFVVKLETYLRIANIKYEFDDVETMGPKGKTPWITFNGKDYADSQLIIEFLNKKLSIDLDSHLSPEEKAVSRFINITINEHLFWALEYWLVVDPEKKAVTLMNFPFYIRLLIPIGFPLMQRRIRKKVNSMGLGVHTDSEIESIMKKNLEALSLHLGTKQFMMGDRPSEVDSSAFGHLVQFAYAMPGSPFETMVKKTYPNIEKYVIRMKQKFYSDWNKLLDK